MNSLQRVFRSTEKSVGFWFIALFVVAAVLRLMRLDETPRIYPDEATYLDFAHSLLRGEFRWGLFSATYLPRLPLPLVQGQRGKLGGHRCHHGNVRFGQHGARRHLQGAVHA